MHYGAGVLQLLNEETSKEEILNVQLRKSLKSLPLAGLGGNHFQQACRKTAYNTTDCVIP